MSMPPAVLFPAGIETSRALAGKGVEVIAAVQADSATLRNSRSVHRLVAAPPHWDEQFEEWFREAPFPEDAVILPGNDDAVWWLAARLHPAAPSVPTVRVVLVK